MTSRETVLNRSFKQLFALVVPIAVQNLFNALVSASDALMLGFLDQTSLSAVSLAAQIQFVFNLFLAALTIGTSVLAAQYWGKKDIDAVETILAIALKASILISLCFFLVTLLCPQILMRILTNETALLEAGKCGVDFWFAGIAANGNYRRSFCNDYCKSCRICIGDDRK